MQLDVTLHPFDEREYIDLVLGVVAGRRPPEDLYARYAIDSEALRLMTAWVPRMRDALRALRAGDGLPWSTVVNLATAAMSAHVHPAYYLRDLGLSYWSGGGDGVLRPYSRSMAILAARVPEIGVAVSEIRESFAGPCSAGSYVSAGDVPLLLRDLERRPAHFAVPLAQAGYDVRETLWVVCEVLHYARERNLAVLEAAGVASPERPQALFPAANLRSAARGSLNDAVGRRVARLLEGTGVAVTS